MIHGSFRKMLKETIHESQKCQRNWDLSKNIPNEDKELIIESATNCPSKQNLNYYKLHVIEDRHVIKNIADCTKGFGPIYSDYDHKTTKGHYKEDSNEDGEFFTNSQVLANMLLVFTENKPELIREKDDQYDQDRDMAIGIAAGYVNVISTILGYSTGCCKCFDNTQIEEIIDDKPILLMGIGFNDNNKDRRQHQECDFKFPSLKRMKHIQVIRYHE